ncbi:MAG: histidinol dehydrogenase, partial [Azorhizobium sp. 39-67-5]
MPIRLDTRAPGFAAAFSTFLDSKREASADVAAAVAEIIARVRADGDGALVDLSRTFDRVDLATLGIRVSAAEIAAARTSIAPET